ncbi:MAG: uL30 family ribosomal protein [Thermoprotei archaeon]
MVETIAPKLLVIRLAGEAGLSPKKIATLEYLGLKKKNWAVLIDANPSYVGMLKAVEREVVWGPADGEALSILAQWVRLGQDGLKKLEAGDSSALPRVFRFHPPIKGYGDFRRHKGDVGKDVVSLLKKMA